MFVSFVMSMIKRQNVKRVQKKKCQEGIFAPYAKGAKLQRTGIFVALVWFSRINMVDANDIVRLLYLIVKPCHLAFGVLACFGLAERDGLIL